jgi:hypothetical protein
MVTFVVSTQKAALALYPFSRYSPAYSAAPNGQPPPIGSGSASSPVTAGDATGSQLPAASGSAQVNPTEGTNFAHQSRDTQPKVNLIMAVPNRGNLVVLTFQPSSLSAQQLQQVEGIIGNVSEGASYQDITVDEGQLKQMQDILAPYPQDSTSAVPMRDGRERSFVNSDNPAATYPKYESSPQFDQEKPSFEYGVSTVRQMAPRHVIRIFCRYLVILGVVVACIFMAFAAAGVAMGHRNAGAKVISTAAGLMILVMSYSIYKIVMLHVWNARGPQVMDLDDPGAPLESRGYSGDTNLQKAGGSGTGDSLPVTTPKAPVAIPASPSRAGTVVSPLGAQVVNGSQ